MSSCYVADVLYEIQRTIAIAYVRDYNSLDKSDMVKMERNDWIRLAAKSVPTKKGWAEIDWTEIVQLVKETYKERSERKEKRQESLNGSKLLQEEGLVMSDKCSWFVN